MAPMIAIRADAGHSLGSGHVQRTLALAAALRERGLTLRFLMRACTGHLFDAVRAAGHEVWPLPAELPDWLADASACVPALAGCVGLIVDHYGLDARWQRAITWASGVPVLLAIDDLADRPHAAPLLLDVNELDASSTRYAGFVPPDCRLLLGPRHALLRAEFGRERARLRERDGTVRRVLVNFGGSDPLDATAIAWQALQAPECAGLELDVIVGAAYVDRSGLARACASRPHTQFTVQAQDMAARLAAADLAIGAGGTGCWERAALGVPALVCAIADNQHDTVTALAARAALRQLPSPDAGAWRAAVLALIRDRFAVAALGRTAATLCDGAGAVRVADCVLEFLAGGCDDRYRLRA